VLDPQPEQRELMTLRELMIMVRDARQDHVPVSLVVETKHPNDRGREVDERVAAMLTEFGWDHPGAPVRLLSFSVKAVKRFGWLLPGWNAPCSSKMILADGVMAGCRTGYASSGRIWH
jgi:glycerophosphoryl diester phosphodiesterase